MDIENLWNKALKNTEIVRTRVQGLMTHSETQVPYVLLSESSINLGDTIVRKGEVVVQRPSLFVPPHNPQFEGFNFGESDLGFGESALVNFLLVRGITLPSLRYDNRTNCLDVKEGSLSNVVKQYEDLLQKEENTRTGLIIGPEDCWQLSLLIFICSQIAKNADTDIKRLLDDYHKRQKEKGPRN